MTLEEFLKNSYLEPQMVKLGDDIGLYASDLIRICNKADVNPVYQLGVDFTQAEARLIVGIIELERNVKFEYIPYSHTNNFGKMLYFMDKALREHHQRCNTNS